MDSLKSGNVLTKQHRIAKIAYEQMNGAIKSLNHYLDLDWMKEAYRLTRKDGASGIDGITAKEYEKNLEGNLKSLINRAKAGTYYAPPVKRVYIPKPGAESEKRPIGIPTFEDKILQRAVAMVMEPIFETHFRPSSYGFRPKRSAHQALEKTWSGLMGAPMGWIIDLDIKSYFDSIDKKILRLFVAKWVKDGVIQRLIGKWLNAGIMENKTITYKDQGTPQGGVISPMLSNLYLHHVLDMWFEQVVQPRLKQPATLIRFADDAILIFRNKEDADKVYQVIAKRFERFGLKLHPEKTKLIRFHKPDVEAKEAEYNEHIDFLGFTHYWGKSRKGKWVVSRKTQKKKFKIALVKITEWCKANRNQPVPVQRKVLHQKLNGHYAYFGITGNYRRLKAFFYCVRRIWHKWLNRRDRSHSLSWNKMELLLQKHPLPIPRIIHSVYAAKL